MNELIDENYIEIQSELSKFSENIKKLGYWNAVELVISDWENYNICYASNLAVTDDLYIVHSMLCEGATILKTSQEIEDWLNNPPPSTIV